MRLWNILWSMYSGRPRSVQRFSTWSRQAEDLLYFNRSRNKHSLINTTGIAGKQKTQQKLLPRILIFCEVHPKNTQGMPESCSRKSRWFGEVFEHGICGGQNLVEQCGVGLENEDTKRFQEMLRSESHMLWNVQLFHFLCNQQQNMEELQSCPHSFLSKPNCIAHASHIVALQTWKR